MSGMPRLTPFLKASYGLGSTAEAVAYTATASFLMLFYNQVRGLPAAHIGTALACGLIVNAIFDPLVGSWSDRTRSKWGRRHPFMFFSILPVAGLFWAVFNPPDWSETGQLIWLAVANTMLLQAMTLYHTPHLALGGEMSRDYLERTSIMNYNTYCLWIGDTLGWVLSFRVFFAATEQFPNGALDPSRWPLFSTTVALFMVAILLYSSLSTIKVIPHLPLPAADTPKFSLKSWFGDIMRTLKNRNYVMLLAGLFFLAMMIGVRGGLWLYGATYYWRLTNNQISYFVIGSFAGYLFAALAVKKLHAKIDKRWTGAGAVALYSAGPAIPLTLGWFGILSWETPGLLWILIAFSVLQHIPFSLMTTTVSSVLADIADENELKFGLRQEGALYATRTFFQRVDQALGTAIAGWVLAIIAFPEKAVPGQVPDATLQGLAAAFALSTIPGLVCAYFYSRLQITRESHGATQAALAARNAEDAPQVPPAGIAAS